MRKFAATLGGALALCGTTVSAQDMGYSDSWKWGAEVYFWGASVGGTTQTGADIDLPIGDIVKNLKFGAMGTVAARKDKWTLFADLIYLNLGDSETVNGAIGGIPVSISADLSLKGFTTTLGAGYRVLEQPGMSLDVTGGARYLWMKAEVDITSPVSVSESTSQLGWDAVVGLRGKNDINDKWYLTYYADIGTGSSDLTWQAAVAANYRMKKADITFGYRYLDFEFDDNGPLDNLNMSGVFAGVKFAF